MKHFLSIILLAWTCLTIGAQSKWVPDSLGHGYEMRYVNLGHDFSGAVRCTVIKHASDCPASNRAVLYIHGYNDYFFQTEMGELFARNCYGFFALDLRKYGRSIINGQHPFLVRSFNDYFADIDSALSIITSEGFSEIALMGHSTGGLLAAYYMATHPKSPVKSLILNSPFLDWNLGKMERFIGIASALGRIFPNIKIDTGGAGVYAQSLLKSDHGEWSYDESKKSTSYGVDLGWVRAVNLAQKYLRKHKYAIKVPVLLMYSAKSTNPESWNQEAQQTDVVLDVNDIKKYGSTLSTDLTKLKVNGGLHDLLLSRPGVRYQVYDYIFRWLNKKMPEVKN